MHTGSSYDAKDVLVPLCGSTSTCGVKWAWNSWPIMWLAFIAFCSVLFVCTSGKESDEPHDALYHLDRASYFYCQYGVIFYGNHDHWII